MSKRRPGNSTCLAHWDAVTIKQGLLHLIIRYECAVLKIMREGEGFNVLLKAWQWTRYEQKCVDDRKLRARRNVAVMTPELVASDFRSDDGEESINI